MATHQCSACLKKTIEDRDDLPSKFVLAGSNCVPRPTFGHNWVAVQQVNRSDGSGGGGGGQAESSLNPTDGSVRTTTQTAAADQQAAGVKKRKVDSILINVKEFKPVADSQNHFILNLNHKFVDLDRVVDDCVLVILDQLEMVTTHDTRVPPVVLMRFARGGKTTTLSALFDKLKQDGEIHPIMISFNGGGSSPFKLREGETQVQAILRLVAIQLGDFADENLENLVVNREALEKHLAGSTKVVLLIDELNNLSLGAVLHRDAAELLRTMFLDKKGRFLVFTSHFPVSIEADQSPMASDFLGNTVLASMRGVVTVDMSLAQSIDDLRAMSTACEGLTEERAAWLGYIPSLIYCTMAHDAFSPSKRFKSMNIHVPVEFRPKLLQSFVLELLSGIRDPFVTRFYGALANMSAEGTVSYPLCYVKEIFEQLNNNEAVGALITVMTRLESQLNSKHSGLAWECTVEVAIILRMLQARWIGSEGPFNLVPEATKPDLAFRILPDDCETLDKAKSLMDVMIAEYKSPTLIYVGSATARFPDVEGFVVYTAGDMATTKIVGFQMKTNDVKPSRVINKEILNGGGVLIRGCVTSLNPRSPKEGWYYMTSKEVHQFLGRSLLLAIPHNMRSSSESAAEAFEN